MSKSFRDFITHPELLTVSRPFYRLRSSSVLGVLMLAGYAGNYFNLPLLFGWNFLFGSIAVLIVVSLYGMVWGTIAAATSGLCTIFLWEHPYAAIILTLEGLFVGWCLRRRHQNLLLLDGFYWIFIAIPLMWPLYSGVMGLQAQTVLLVMLKLSVNGIFNALIASLLLNHSPLHNWVARPKVAKTLSLQQTLFNVLVAFVFFPSLSLIVLQTSSTVSKVETTIQANLQNASTDLDAELRFWYGQHQIALQQLVAVATHSDRAPLIALQESTELLQRAFPAFHQLFVTNESGKAIASYPDLDKLTSDSINLKASDLKKPIAISEFVIAGEETSSLMLIQRLPITRNQRFVGSVVSKLNLSFVEQLIKSFAERRQLAITLLDRQERVIASTDSNRPTLQAFNPGKGGEIRPLNSQVYQWLPVIKKTPVVERWKNSSYVQKTPARENFPWTLIVEAPTYRHFNSLQDLYIKVLAFILLIAALALLLANIISRRLARPLWKLAEVTTDVPDKLLDQKAIGLQQRSIAIAWPISWVTEINALVENFKVMASTLEQKFQEIKSAKEQLEQRVQERTRELSVANRELKAEVAERKRVVEALQKSEALSTAQAQKLEKALHELKLTQAQLVQTEKMSSLGQLVAGVAHEINNPVNFIYGNLIHAKDYTQDLLRLVQVYQRQYPNPTAILQAEIEEIELDFVREDLPKLLDSMQVGATRIHEIVKSLRNFSRLDEAEIKEVDIHEGIDSTLMLLKSRLKAPLCAKGEKHPGIEVIKEYGKLPLVECYPGKLNQVFMNILVNAIDALEEIKIERLLAQQGVSVSEAARSTVSRSVAPVEGSHNGLPLIKEQPATLWIRIRTEVVENDWVAICIADNGVGIKQELSSKLFDPFFTTKAVGQGTGLGLSISYQIVVERHGGKLECISVPKKGTEFIIKIPRLQSGVR